MKTPTVAPPGYHLVYCTAFRHYRTGQLITAAAHGKKCFVFVVPD